MSFIPRLAFSIYFSTYFRFVLLLSTGQLAIIIVIQVIQLCVKIPLSRLILSRLRHPRNRRWLQGILGEAGMTIIREYLLLRNISSAAMIGGLILAIGLIYLGLAIADTTVDTVFISLHKQ